MECPHISLLLLQKVFLFTLLLPHSSEGIGLESLDKEGRGLLTIDTLSVDDSLSPIFLEDKEEEKILGGEEITAREFPFFVG